MPHVSNDDSLKEWTRWRGSICTRLRWDRRGVDGGSRCDWGRKRFRADGSVSGETWTAEKGTDLPALPSTQQKPKEPCDPGSSPMVFSPLTVCWACEAQEGKLCFLLVKHQLSEMHSWPTGDDRHLIQWVLLANGRLYFLAHKFNLRTIPELFHYLCACFSPPLVSSNSGFHWQGNRDTSRLQDT